MSRYRTTLSWSVLAVFASLVVATFGLRAEEDGPKGPNKRNQNFKRHDFTKKGEDLQYADFRDSNCTEARFNRVNLTGADFRDANVEFARFDECDLSKADFRDALLTGAAFRVAVMAGANLEECKNFDASNVTSLRKAKLKKAELKGSLENTDLREADLRGANLSGVHYFPGAKFKKAYYSDETIFMDGFDPAEQGMIKKDIDDDLSEDEDSKKKK